MSRGTLLDGMFPTGDYRLVGPAVTTWAVSLVVLLGPSWIGWPLAVTGVGGCLACTTAVRSGRVSWSAVSVVVVASGMAAMTAGGIALRVEARAEHPLSQVDGKVRVAGVIRDDPVSVGPARTGRVRMAADIDVVDGRRAIAMRAELTAAADTWSELVPGQRFSATVRVGPPRRGELIVGRLAAVSAPRLTGRPPPHQRLAVAIRQRLQEVSARALGPEAAGLLPGLVLGDTSALDAEVRNDFRAAGLSHLVAVSGSNFSIVCGAAVMAVRMLGASPRVTALAGALIVVAFVILVRPSPSVLRAAMMGMVGLLALVRSRRAQALPALGAATIIGLLCWPDMALAPGFALSVLATVGLVLWSSTLRDWLRGRRIPSGLAELVAMALAAQLVTAPIIALMSGRFSVAGIVANVLVVPVVALIGIVGTTAAVVGAIGARQGIGSSCAELMIRALGPELWWMLTCARMLGGQSWATVPVPSGVTGAAVVAAVTMLSVVTVVHAPRLWRAARRGGRMSVGSIWHDGRRD